MPLMSKKVNGYFDYLRVHLVGPTNKKNLIKILMVELHAF